MASLASVPRPAGLRRRRPLLDADMVASVEATLVAGNATAISVNSHGERDRVYHRLDMYFRRRRPELLLRARRTRTTIQMWLEPREQEAASATT